MRRAACSAGLTLIIGAFAIDKVLAKEGGDEINSLSGWPAKKPRIHSIHHADQLISGTSP
jgi:hypothetical protein